MELKSQASSRNSVPGASVRGDTRSALRPNRSASSLLCETPPALQSREGPGSARQCRPPGRVVEVMEEERRDHAVEDPLDLRAGREPLGLAQALRLSRATMRGMRQNLFFAFAYNLLGVPVAAGLLYPVCGWLMDPMLASAAMSLSSVSVIVNSLRLRRVEL